jgi:hypothetical protein
MTAQIYIFLTVAICSGIIDDTVLSNVAIKEDSFS